MSETKPEERVWHTVIEVCYMDSGEYKGQWIVQTKHYYFHTQEEAKQCAHDLKDIFNANLNVKFGAKFDQDMKLGTN